MKKLITKNFERTAYGEIINYQNHFSAEYEPYLQDLINEAFCMIKQAGKKKKIPPAYDTLEWDRKKRVSGYALHHELYDVSDDGRHALICIRETKGNGKYGVSTTSKTYFILSAHGKGLRIQETKKSKAAKAAKQATTPGHAIKVCLGKEKLYVHTTEKRTGFKIVAKTETGFSSVYDGSPWTMGQSRVEKSSMNHESGFYVFPTVQTALTAWKDRLVFAEEWMTEEKYSLLECECSGRSYTFNNDKICISRVKPVSEIAEFITK